MCTRRVFAPVLLGALIASGPANSQSFNPPPPKEGESYAVAYCTNRGLRVELDEVSCLRVGSEVFLARCDMSLNSPTWRKVQDGCPAALEEPDVAVPSTD